MPETLTIRDFTGGWKPSADPLNIAKNAFLQQDNLYLNKEGSLQLVGGSQTRRTLAANPHTIFNTDISGSDVLYSALTNGAIYREGTSIGTGGSSTRAAFSTAFDFTLIASGAKRLKDNGTTVADLGVQIPAAAVTIDKQDFISASLDSPTNDPFQGGGAAFIQSGTQLRWTAAHSFDGSTTFGTINFVANAATNTDESVLTVPTTDLQAPIDLSDTISVTVSLNSGSTFHLLDQVLEIWIVAVDGDGNVIDFRWQTSRADPTGVNVFGKGTVTLTVDRNNLQAARPFDWSSIATMGGFLVTTGNEDDIFDFILDDHWTGGPWNNPDNLNNIEYMQVNIANTGSYVAKSTAGPSSGFLYTNGFAFIVKPAAVTDPQVTEVWIFRRGNTLADWRRVLIFPIASIGLPQIDGMLDNVAAQQIGWDLSLLSTQAIDDVLEIVGPYEGRWFFFTSKFCYPSDILDPDLVNGASQVVRIITGDHEQFYWAKPISEEEILVGTSHNIYVLQGTFATLPDGTIDVFYKPLNVTYPPINRNAEYFNGLVFYMASDGWRSISPGGANPTYVVPATQRLWNGEDCAGYSKAIKTTTPIVICRNSLFGGVNNRVEVYDFTRNQWYNLTMTGNVLCACKGITGLPLFAIGSSVITLADHSVTPSISYNLLAGKYDFGSPRRRKDLYTIHIGVSGSGSCVVSYAIDNSGSFTSLTTITLNSSTFDFVLSFETVDPDLIARILQLKIAGTATDFTLNYILIEYDNRPEQVTALKLPSWNGGTASKKRLRVWPIELDLMGANVTFTPYFDGVADSSKNVALTGSAHKTYLLHYAYDCFNIDYSGVLIGDGPFEVWNILAPEVVQVLPIAKRFDQIGPEELGRYAKINTMEVRMLAFGVLVPYKVFFQDGVQTQGNLVTVSGVEDTYELNFNRGVAGKVLRIEFGPTNFDFHRYYARILCIKTGDASEKGWVTIPGQV